MEGNGPENCHLASWPQGDDHTAIEEGSLKISSALQENLNTSLLWKFTFFCFESHLEAMYSCTDSAYLLSKDRVQLVFRIPNNLCF